MDRWAAPAAGATAATEDVDLCPSMCAHEGVTTRKSAGFHEIQGFYNLSFYRDLFSTIHVEV